VSAGAWRRAYVLSAGLGLSLLGGGAAAAQAPEPRLQLSVGGLWQGGSALGAQPANETRNQLDGGSYTLFETTTDVEAAGGLEARLTWWVTRAVAAEIGGAWATPRIVTRVTADAEGAPGLAVASDAAQYVIDAAAVLRLRRLSMAGGRVEPFLTAGVGYLRQVYDGNLLIETGTTVHGGGGAFIWFRPAGRGWLKRAGLRADARWTRQNGGVAFGESGHRAFPTLAAGALLQF
jgi:hypothetical protein